MNIYIEYLFWIYFGTISVRQKEVLMQKTIWEFVFCGICWEDNSRLIWSFKSATKGLKNSVTKLAELQKGFMLSLCTLNFVFCITAILGNLLVIHALWKVSLIPDSLKKLFLSLAFSDLAVGLFVQPMHGAIIAAILQMASNGDFNADFFCPTIVTIYLSSAYLFSVASFLSIVTIAVDRLLAVSLHLRYQEFVTNKRVEIVLGILWLTSFVITFIYISLPKYNDIVAVVLEVAGIVVTSAANFRKHFF